MGVDIYSDSGVVVTADQLLQIVREENREQVCRVLLRRTATLLKTLRDDSESEEFDERERSANRQQASLMIETFQSLTVDSSVEDIRTMLRGIATGVEDGFDSHVKNSDEAVEIWSNLIEALFPNVPTPESTEFVGAPRYQGWDLPLGEVLFVFSEVECFERVKTQAGEALDAMIGTATELSSWTTYSI